MAHKGFLQKAVKTPTILQMEATECGAVALTILLAYYKRFITTEEARIACSVSRDGTTAINIVKAARNYGMEASGANLEIDELDSVQVPFIAYWEFNHFLIVNGYDHKYVYLNDPATGPRKVGWDEFERCYTGVVLEIVPGKKFQTGGEPKISTLTLLLERLGKNYIPMLFIILTTIALIIPKIATPIFIKAFIDYLLIDNQKSLIPVVLLGLAFTTIAVTFLTWLQKKFLRRLQVKLDLINAVHFLWHLLHLSIRYFQQRATGDIAQRNYLNEKIAALLANDLPENIVGIIEMLAFAAVIAYLSWQISIILLILTLLNTVAVQSSNRYVSDVGLRYSQDRGKLDGLEANGIQIMETLKVSGLEQHFFNRWAAYYTKFLNTEHRITWVMGLLSMIPDLLAFWSNIAILCLGAYLVMIGDITIGTIVAIQSLASNFQEPLHNLISLLTKFNELKGDIVRLDDVVHTRVDSRFERTTMLSKVPKNLGKKPVLRIKNLSFSYSPLDPPILDNINLELYPGERIAIVGPSGSGKSSLAKLVCGLYEPMCGEIYFNGANSKKFSHTALSTFLAYVNQDICFFPGTLRSNLSLWDNNISDEQIFTVLRQVNFYQEVIDRGGLAAHINESGSNFSGGQCQRLEIARALLRQPSLLILDEATSAMDTRLEREVYHNLLCSQHSLFIIAHRLSAIQNCDRIYVLSEGQIREQGTHTELMRYEGLYHELVSMEAS